MIHARTIDCLIVKCRDVWRNEVTLAVISLNDANREVCFLMLFLLQSIPYVMCGQHCMNKSLGDFNF